MTARWVLLCWMLVLTASPLSAATLTWGGGSGTWNTTSTVWNGSTVAWPAAGTDVALFGGTAGTVTISGSIAANGLTFDVAGYAVAGGTLTLTPTTPKITANEAATISSVITGTQGLQKDGAGALTLSGANTYSGGTIISAGRLVAASASALGASNAALTISGGQLDLGGGSRTVGAVSITAAAAIGNTIESGTLTGSSYTVSNASGNVVIPAVLAGLGDFEKSGAGVLTLSAANTYSGITTLSGGTINVGSLSNLGVNGSLGNRANDIAGVGILFRGGVLQYTGSTAQTTNRAIRVGLQGATLDASGSLPEATMSFTASSSPDFFENPGNRTVTFTGSNTGNNTFAMAINDAGVTSVVKSGQGTWVLSGSSNYSGGTTISGGLLRVGSATALGATTGPLTTNGGRLDLNGNSITTGAVSITAAATTGDTIQSGTLSGSSYTVSNPSGTAVISAVLAGSGGVSKSGAGMLTLSAQNSYSGATTVTGGTLALSGGRNGTMGNVAVAGTNAVLLISSGSYGLGSNGFGLGGGQRGTANQTGGVVTFTGGNQLLVGTGSGGAGAFTLTGGTITTAVVADRGVMLGVNPNSSGTFTMTGGALNMTAATGAGGDAMLQIGRYDSNETGQSGAFNQSGGVASVGILSIGGTGSIQGTGGTQVLTLTGGTFSANQFPRLSAGNSNVATITISGSADVTLPAFPTARGTGATSTVSFDGGVLRPAAASTSYMTGLTNAFIRSGGITFDVPTGRDITIGQALLTDGTSLGGGLVKTGAGTLTLSGSSTYTGTTTVSAGVLQIGNGSTTGSIATASSVSVASGATLVFNRSDSLTYGGTISGAGALTNSGSGTLVLAGANSYTGNSSVSAGTLQFGNGGTGGTVPSGTIALSQTGNVTFNYGDNRTLTNTFTLTSGQANAGTLTQSGSGTLTLQGTQQFRAITTTDGAGSLAIGGGTLTLGRASGSDTFDSRFTAAPGTAITISGSLATTVTSGGSFLYKFGGGTLYLGNATGVAFSELIIPGGALDIVGSLQETLKGRRILFSGTTDPVLQASGSYTPSGFGANGNNVGWNASTSDGGFAARSGPLTVNIGNGQTLTYQTGAFTQSGFIGSGRTLVFGSETSDNVVTLQNPLNLAGGTQTIKVVGNANPNNAAVLAGAISNGGIVKTGSGWLTLSASNSYALATTISGGRLEIASGGQINGTSGITINGVGAELKYNSATPLTQAITFTQGTLSGTGTIGTAVTAGANDILSPGNSPGAQSFTSGLTWDPAGTYLWEMNDATGGNGTGWDIINVSGGSGLTINATSGTTFKIAITSLSGTAAGNATNFSATTSGSWTILSSASGISGFAANKFNLDRSAFTNTSSGSFTISQVASGTNQTLVLAYNTISALSSSTSSVTGFRVMQGQSTTTAVNLLNAGPDATGYSLSPAGGLSLVSGSTGTLAGGGTQAITFGYASTAATGARSGTVSFTNTGNAGDALGSIAVSGAVVTNRVVTASVADFGLVHLGASGTATSTFTSTGSDNDFTRITVGNGTGGGLTVSGSSGFVFNGSGGSSRTVAGTFATAGALSGTISLTNASAETGGTLPGQVPGTTGLAYSASVFSGTATWDVAGGGSWGSGASSNWTSTGGVQAAPGTLSGYSNTDMAIFAGTQGGTSTVLLNGATPSLAAISFTNTANRYVLDQGSGGSLTLAASSGKPTIDVVTGGLHEINTAILGSAGLAKLGGGTLVLSGSNGFTGGTDVSFGTLAVNGSLGGAVNVANGAVLGGAGALNGLVTVAGGGILAPGNSPGTLTMNAGLVLADSSFLNFELSATDFTVGGGINDLINVNGTFTLDGILNVTGLGDFSTVANNTKWRLFNYDTGGTFTNNGLSLGVMPSVGASGKYFQIDTSTAGQVNLVIVPEPGAASLVFVGLSAAALSAARRRRAGR